MKAFCRTCPDRSGEFCAQPPKPLKIGRRVHVVFAYIGAEIALQTGAVPGPVVEIPNPWKPITEERLAIDACIWSHGQELRPSHPLNCPE